MRKVELMGDFPLKFRHIDENLTPEQLNEGYGKYGMFFKSRSEAEYYAKGFRNPRISRVFDGVGNDKYVKGYLVTTTQGMKY